MESSSSTEMVEINGYQNLAMLFRKKHTMLSINVLNILFDCVQDTEENRWGFSLFRKKHTMLSINVLNILFDCVQDTEENR